MKIRICQGARPVVEHFRDRLTSAQYKSLRGQHDDRAVYTFFTRRGFGRVKKTDPCSCCGYPFAFFCS